MYIASLLEKNLKKTQNFSGLRSKVKAERSGAWLHHEIPEQAMACTIQKVLHTMNPPPIDIQNKIGFGQLDGFRSVEEYDSSQIIGAKMIRIQEGDWSPAEAVDFFNYNFPCAKFIINTRSNIDDMARSQKTFFKRENRHKNYSQVHDELEKENQFLHMFAKEMGSSKSRLIFMGEWTANVTALNEVVEWAGFQNCRFNSTFHHNKNGYNTDKKSVIGLGDKCQVLETSTPAVGPGSSR